MLLREKGNKDAEPVSHSWDDAQAALASGKFETIPADERMPDPKGAEKPEGEAAVLTGDKAAAEKDRLEAQKAEAEKRAEADKAAAEKAEAERKAKAGQ